MHKRLLGLTSVLIISACMAFSVRNTGKMKEKGHLTVHITNLQSMKGQILLALYDNAKAFPEDGDKAVASKAVAVNAKTVTIEIKDLKPGNYAIALVHDENSNNEMDKNLLGIPQEGYGFSNVNSVSMMQPSFKDASFFLKPGKQTVNIKLLHI